MNKTIILTIMSLMTSCLTQAAMFEQSDISVSAKGRLVLERSQAEGTFARNDRIILKAPGETVEVFASEGRAVENVIEEDIDGSGERELLIQMDLGGSGGFKEFALLQLKDGKYETVWEETGFCAGHAAIEDRDGDGRLSIYIDYTNTDIEPPKEETAIFVFENGEVKQ
ncbi:MAG: hypothetical protein EOM80_13830 [Erysipelotrichia bacterium]|nr:hypothetical protein [Erysipelotrichia bacterium]